MMAAVKRILSGGQVGSSYPQPIKKAPPFPVGLFCQRFSLRAGVR